jgi:hypothetical protein
MKTSKFFLVILATACSLSCNKQPTNFYNSVNAILGDISFIEKFGVTPTLETKEDLRLKTHLEYVENLLRGRDASMLSKEQKQNRKTMLDLLHDYRTAGVFPKNYDFPDQRIPCFIDKDGRICAVGYLIEQTAGRHAAEEINSKFKYEYLLAMNDQRIDDWIDASGLTKEECAMIQPTYGPGPNYVSPGYGVTSALASGLNVSMITVNAIQISKGAKTKTVGIIGLISGAGQVALGAFNYPNEEGAAYWGNGQPDQRNISLMNIGIGTSTMILSTWNLIANRKPKEKSISWNIYGFPTQAKHVGVGFSLKKRL